MVARQRRQRSHWLFTLAVIASTAGVVLGQGAPAQASGRLIERVGDGGVGIAISADGRFLAFTNDTNEVVLLDRDTDVAQTVAPGALFNLGYTSLDITADGRYLAFSSNAPLLPDEAPLCGTPDVYSCTYVYDREQNTYEVVSVGGSGWFDSISISDDGRFVTSSAGLHDRLSGITQVIGGKVLELSANGRFVVFDGDGVSVLDRDTDEDGIFDEPEAVGTAPIDPQGIWPTISDDGRFVAYSALGNIVLHDRQTGASTPVGLQGSNGAALDLSADGRYLAFAGRPLAPQDGSHMSDVFLYDRLTGSVELLSVAPDGTLPNANSAWGYYWEQVATIALTPDGRYAAFHSQATNLVPGAGAGLYLVDTQAVVDSDRDGCSDKEELGVDEAVGGRRDPNSVWDLMSVFTGMPLTRDAVVGASDITAIVRRFGVTDMGPGAFDRNSDPLSTPTAPVLPANSRANYHPSYDRGGSAGPNPWNLLPADGAIAAAEIAAAVIQFGHRCTAPP